MNVYGVVKTKIPPLDTRFGSRSKNNCGVWSRQMRLAARTHSNWPMFRGRQHASPCWKSTHLRSWFKLTQFSFKHICNMNYLSLIKTGMAWTDMAWTVVWHWLVRHGLLVWHGAIWHENGRLYGIDYGTTLHESTLFWSQWHTPTVTDKDQIMALKFP